MQDNLCGATSKAINVAYRLNACVYRFSEIAPVTLANIQVWKALGQIGAQHSAIGLVSYLNKLWQQSLFVKVQQRGIGISINRVTKHLNVGNCFPGLRQVLVARVCPGVRIVEIEQYFHT